MSDISQLHPDLQVKVAKLKSLCEDKNLKIGIGECVRTVAEQDNLYAQGRTKPGKIVTNAKGSTYSSMHQWGVAFDFYRNDGKGAFYDGDGFFSKVGQIGQSIGLEWGGSWKSIVDKPHFQLSGWGSTTAVLKKSYGTPEKFRASWPKEDPADKYGKKLAEKKMRVIKASYLRTTPEVNKNRVSYKELSATLKKKCRNKNGYAVFEADEIFTRIRSYTDKKGNKWKQLKSGYWFPAVYEGIRRACSDE